MSGTECMAAMPRIGSCPEFARGSHPLLRIAILRCRQDGHAALSNYNPWGSERKADQVEKGRDEDDRRTVPTGDQEGLQLQAAQAWHLHIRD
jgi:hypothetical protein